MAAKTPRLPVTLLDAYDGDFWASQRDLMDNVESALQVGNYTTDYPQLAKKEFHYLFTYGTLKKGFKFDHKLDNSPCIGVGMTKHDRFYMAIEKEAKFPIAFFDTREEYRSRLYGEVYKVEPWVIRDTDYLESNDILYKRYKLPIEVFQRDGSKQTVSAWTYIGVKQWWEKRINRLIPAKRAVPKTGDSPYFIFTKADT